MKCLVFIVCLLFVAENRLSADWPTYRHDVRRSGVSDESLSFPLQLLWSRESKVPPQPAWTGPAKWDAWAGNSGLQSMRNFDPCFYVTVAAGQLFFGSSVDDAVHAIDTQSGKERWVHFTGAAVRFPPTLDSQRAYFGSDDGIVYCCDQQTGALIWHKRAAPDFKPVTSNRKIISTWPVRTGVLIRDGKACFAGSLVPWNTSYLWQVDAATGSVDRAGCFRTEVTGVTLQGALLASSERIYVPQGRSAPLAFDTQSGDSLGAIGEAGGVFCLLTDDEMLLTGPQNQNSATNQIRVSDGSSQRRLATFSGSNRILVANDRAWIPIADKLKLLNRSTYVQAQAAIDAANAIMKDKSTSNDQAIIDLAKAKQQQTSAWHWESECPEPSDLIKAGESIIVGLENEVRAYSANDGKLIWKASVDGVVHGLAVADGALFVSTGLGHIYAFGVNR